MSYEEYAIYWIGRDKYKKLLKKYNLRAKDWTYGRVKYFCKEVDKLIEAEQKKYYKNQEKVVQKNQKLFNIIKWLKTFIHQWLNR